MVCCISLLALRTLSGFYGCLCVSDVLVCLCVSVVCVCVDVCTHAWTADAGTAKCSSRGAEHVTYEFSSYRRKILRKIKSCTYFVCWLAEGATSLLSTMVRMFPHAFQHIHVKFMFCVHDSLLDQL